MSALEVHGIDHVVVRVADLDRALAFYEGALGCAVERRLDDLGLVQLRAGASLIDLVPLASPLGRAGGAGPGPEGHNVDHFALRIAQFDEGALRAHLLAHGVAPGDARLNTEELPHNNAARQPALRHAQQRRRQRPRRQLMLVDMTVW